MRSALPLSLLLCTFSAAVTAAGAPSSAPLGSDNTSELSHPKPGKEVTEDALAAARKAAETAKSAAQLAEKAIEDTSIRSARAVLHAARQSEEAAHRAYEKAAEAIRKARSTSGTAALAAKERSKEALEAARKALYQAEKAANRVAESSKEEIHRASRASYDALMRARDAAEKAVQAAKEWLEDEESKPVCTTPRPHRASPPYYQLKSKLLQLILYEVFPEPGVRDDWITSQKLLPHFLIAGV